MKSYEINIIKPGASEFKRTEHIIVSYKNVLNAFEEARIKKLKFRDLNKDRLKGGRLLFDLYFENKVVKKTIKPNVVWKDRLTSLFRRENLIMEDEEGYIVPGSLGNFINSNREIFDPFSKADFIQLVNSLSNGKNEESYLQRAIKIIKRGIKNNEDFYFNFLIDVEIELEKLRNMNKYSLFDAISNSIKPGSSFIEKNKELKIIVEKICKEIIDFFKFSFENNNIELRKIKFDELNLNINLKGSSTSWYKFFKNSIKFFESQQLNLENDKEIILNDKNLLLLLLCFNVSKKYSDYKNLIDKYIISLPIFSLKKDVISIEKSFSKYVDFIMDLKNINFENKKIEEIYEQIVPNNLRFEFVDKSKFYPFISDEFLQKILKDNELWKYKKIKNEYLKVLPNLNVKNLPTYYEFLTILSIYKRLKDKHTYEDFVSIINTKLSSDYLPLRFASGGKADAKININDEKILIEPTLTYGREQAKFEIGIWKHLDIHDADFAIMISPEFNSQTINLFLKMQTKTDLSDSQFCYPLENSKIFDIDIDDFKFNLNINLTEYVNNLKNK